MTDAVEEVKSAKLTRCLQHVMARLADLLGDDQFNNIEAIVQSYGVPFPDLGDDPRKDAKPDAASSDKSQFAAMLCAVCELHGQKAIATGIGYSVQYVSDLARERRTPSVAVVNAICKWMGRGPKGRREWHVAGAQASGWEIE